ncbi:unnamed protein product [Nezara viridula]|uniref:CFAP74 fourth Ig-like domain-containing protein n=1 Tax=Nezara viridula TaxID=85310 RepID=A0A9P0MU55_NEZVI|nr:unnamed protein product [Nezara viridula]
MEPKMNVNDCNVRSTEKDPRANCFECFADTPSYNALTAQYSLRQPRPKFLSCCPFKKRLRMEFSLSRKALQKFMESRGKGPIIDLPDLNENLRTSFSVWELARRMSEWMKRSFSSSMTEKKASIVEAPSPGIKEFPLTQESVKKHIEKETAKKKEEKQETILMLKKKQQDLKRLKEELKLQAEKHYCHYDEKLADYELKKIQYLKNLAKRHDLAYNDLMRNGDVIYQNYRSELKKLNEQKLKEIEKRAEINARLLQEELTRQKQLKNLKSHSVPKFIKKKAKKSILEPIIEEEEGSKHTPCLMEPPVTKSEEPLVTPIKGKTKSIHMLKTKQRRFNSVQDNKDIPKPKSPVTSSKMNQETNLLIKKLEKVWSEIEQAWNKEKNEPELPDNDMLIVRPASIIFRDFLPYDDYVETVKMYNPTKESIDCGIFMIYVEPQLDEIMFEIYPEMVTRIRPGGSQNFQVIFMTERWDEVKNGINGTIWFWSKVLKTNSFYRISVPVQCIRFTSDIKVENPIIQFNDVPSWIDFSSTKYLDITNNSKIEYAVYIHRKKKIMSDPLLVTSTDLFETPEKSKLSPLSEIDSPRSYMLQSHPEGIKNPNAENSKQANNKYSEPQSNISLGVTRSKHQSHVKIHQNLSPKKSPRTEESYLAVTDLLELMIEEVYQPFRVHLTRGIFLDRETKMSVPIEFLPHLAGNVEMVEDQLEVSFEGRFLTKDEEVVNLVATMFEQPLSISPAMVDMQVTMVGTGVWQTSFQVTNVSKKFVNVKIEIPVKLNTHFQARPSKFIIRPNQKQDVLLRAKIGWKINEDSGDMLDKNLSLLEFPISIQADQMPQQTLGALAVISNPLALSIEPNTINLGFVNTFETVTEQFWLKNNTVVPLYFGFINVPQSCIIMPMHGFSKIGPAQKIKLNLLYSPSVKEAGKAGGQAVHMFSLICTTLERLAAEKPPMHNLNTEEEVMKTAKSVQPKSDSEQMNTLQELLKMSTDDYMAELGEPTHVNLETMSFLNENLNALSFLEKKEVISPLGPTNVAKRMSLAYYPADIAKEKSTDLDVENTDLLHEKDVQPFISLSCMAIVSDPICELSAQRIILPDIPYGSFSIHHMHLRYPNEVSGISCHCKRFLGLHDDPKQVKISFQFFQHFGKELDIQPVSGTLNYDEKIKIHLVLKPELDLSVNSKEGKLRKPRPIAKAVSKPKVDVKLPKRAESRISRTKLLRIKNLQNSHCQTRIRCLISVKNPEYPEPRFEELFCDLYFKFVRPDIYVATPGSKKEITFPRTAIGTKRVETIEVHNISNQMVNVTRSHFSHLGIFTCQFLPPSPWSYKEYKGIPLEPEQFLKLDLTFSPEEDNYAEEYFELRANNTIVPLNVSGYGAIPRYTISSQFCVCKMEASHGNKVEEVITITNKCEVDLQFEIMKCFQMETLSSDVFKQFLNRYSPAKNISKESYLDPNIIRDIKDNFFESDQTSPITVEPQLIHILPFKKAAIKICFYPKKLPTLTKPINSEEGNIHVTSKILRKANMSRSRNISILDSKNVIEEVTPTFYVQKVQVVLGRLTLVAEWLIIGKIVKDNKKRV